MAMAATFEFDRYVFDTLMRDLVRHDRRPSAFLVYLAIAGFGGDGAHGLSHNDLADATGLSKRSVQDAITHLARRKLIEVQRVGPTEIALYRRSSRGVAEKKRRRGCPRRRSSFRSVSVRWSCSRSASAAGLRRAVRDCLGFHDLRRCSELHRIIAGIRVGRPGYAVG